MNTESDKPEATEPDNNDAESVEAPETSVDASFDGDEVLTEAAADSGRRSSSPLGLIALAGSVAALAAVGWLWLRQGPAPELNFATPGDVTAVANELETLRSSITTLERRIAELANDDSADEMRSELLREVDGRIGALDDRLGRQLSQFESLPPRVGNLENSVAAIQGIDTGARDTLLVAEAEHYLDLANALLTLDGDVELAKVALGMADARLASIGNPALNNVRQAITDELTALDLTPVVDIEKNAMLLASLAGIVDSLPLRPVAGEAADGSDGDEEDDSALAAIREALFGVVKVTPPGSEDAPLLLPGTESLIRANLSLQLQGARLGLIRGEASVFEQSLDDADTWLTTYFDTGSLPVSEARETLAEIRAISLTTAVPDISESLRLIRQYQVLSETTP